MWSQQLIGHVAISVVRQSNGLRAVRRVHRGPERATLAHTRLRCMLCEHVGGGECALMLYQVRRFRVKTHALLAHWLLWLNTLQIQCGQRWRLRGTAPRRRAHGRIEPLVGVAFRLVGLSDQRERAIVVVHIVALIGCGAWRRR